MGKRTGLSAPMKRCLVPLLGVFILVGCATQEPAPTPVRRAEIWRSPIADSPPGAGQIWPSNAPPIHARAAIMIDARSGLTLYQKNADTHIQVASTQKLLTALIIMRRGNLDGRMQIATPDTFVEPTKPDCAPANPIRDACCFRPCWSKARTTLRQHSPAIIPAASRLLLRP